MERMRVAIGVVPGLALIGLLCSLCDSEARCRAVKRGMKREEVDKILVPTGTVIGSAHRWFSPYTISGPVITTDIMVHYNAEAMVAEKTVLHFAGSVCIESQWERIRGLLPASLRSRPTIDEPPPPPTPFTPPGQ